MTDPVAAPTKPKIEFIVAEELEPPYRVLIHNDDVTPMEFVVAVLRTIFELTIERAEAVMLTAHYTGGAVVGAYPREDAKQRIEAAHRVARLEEYPLKFTMEPEA
jgi:ATP-dependent Clp protease adaptor protein ClpS